MLTKEISVNSSRLCDDGYRVFVRKRITAEIIEISVSMRLSSVQPGITLLNNACGSIKGICTYAQIKGLLSFLLRRLGVYPAKLLLKSTAVIIAPIVIHLLTPLKVDSRVNVALETSTEVIILG